MEILTELRQKVEEEIRSILDGGRSPLFGLDTMNAYHMGFADKEGHPVSASKGKYLRPIFCLAICGGLGGDVDKALPAAASLEIVHRTSLIFDDIQDVGKERNGQPTVWTIWGENQAINAGLALSCYGRLAAQRGSQRGIPAETVLRILNVLENAVKDLCWGQYFDLSSMETLNVGVEDYLRMVRGKTAALFRAACEAGAICAGADSSTQETAREFGNAMGIAFQMHDDYLGIWGDENEVGKTANDLQEKKRTLPVVLALQSHPQGMRNWLKAPEITSVDAATIRRWMTNVGIRDSVRNMRSKYIDAAGRLVAALSLQKEWNGQFDQLLSFLAGRKV
jgi:geranylgeranyl diphosphate synthase type I